MLTEHQTAVAALVGGGVLAGCAVARTLINRRCQHEVQLHLVPGFPGQQTGEASFLQLLNVDDAAPPPYHQAVQHQAPADNQLLEVLYPQELSAGFIDHSNRGICGLELFTPAFTRVQFQGLLLAGLLPTPIALTADGIDRAEEHAHQFLRVDADAAADAHLEYAQQLVAQFDLDGDGGLSRQEFRVLLRSWQCISRAAPLSQRSRYSLLRKMCVSAGVMAYGALSCAALVGHGFKNVTFSSGGGAFAVVCGTGVLGFMGVVTSLASFDSAPAIAVATEDAIATVQPRARVVACTQLAASVGVLVSPLWILLDAFKTPARVHTLWWQFLLSPACTLLGAGAYWSLRQLFSHVQQEEEAAAPTRTSGGLLQFAPFGDCVMCAFSGVLTSLVLGGLAHLVFEGVTVRNVLIAPSLWRQCFDTDQAWQQAMGDVDPVSILFGDGLYVGTTLLYGGLVSWHSAGASARYMVDADADHLVGALNMLLDVIAIALKLTETALRTLRAFVRALTSKHQK